MLTINEVARAAGVSRTTVSRVMNGHLNVDAALAERVRHAAGVLNYRPSSLARNLRLQRTAIWILMISDVENPFFTLIARGVEDVAQRAGYSVILCNTDEDVAKEQQYMAVACQEQAAGVILSPVSGTTDISPLTAQQVKVVAIDRPLAGAVVVCVLTDSEAGSFMATQHLLEAGWRTVACITGRPHAATAEARAAGYRRAMQVAGEPEQVRYGDFRPEGGRAVMAELLDTAAPPEAIFVANNLMAVGALQELADRGLRPGADIGVVSFDDPPWAELLDPPLTCIAQSAYDMGTRAAQRLTARLHGSQEQPSTDVMTPVLHVRRSSLRASAGPGPEVHRGP
jgi:LacI family transcriptional regulator